MSSEICYAIDYGHGGLVDGAYQTAGKRYTFTDNDNYTVYEGVLNRIVASMVIHKLPPMVGGRRVRLFDVVAGVEISLEDGWAIDMLDGTGLYDPRRLCPYDISLEHRIAHANRAWREYRAPLISIHHNAAGNSSRGPSRAPRGVSVFTSKGQTASDDLAERMLDAFTEMESRGGLRVRPGDLSDGDRDHEAAFSMLTRTHGPAVLVEGGWFTSYEDMRLLGSPIGLDRSASAYVLGMTGADTARTFSCTTGAINTVPQFASADGF